MKFKMFKHTCHIMINLMHNSIYNILFDQTVWQYVFSLVWMKAKFYFEIVVRPNTGASVKVLNSSNNYVISVDILLETLTKLVICIE